jgi:hypothetical protein
VTGGKLSKADKELICAFDVGSVSVEKIKHLLTK